MRGSEKRYIWTVYTEITMSERNICRHKTRPGWSFNEEHRSKCNTLGALNDEARNKIKASWDPMFLSLSTALIKSSEAFDQASSRAGPTNNGAPNRLLSSTWRAHGGTNAMCRPVCQSHDGKSVQNLDEFSTRPIRSSTFLQYHSSLIAVTWSWPCPKPTYNVLVRGAGNGWASRGGRQKKCAV